MAEQVSLEDVGQAESVISRLVQERRSLESAAKVLQTYRMVKAELQPALDALKVVQGRIAEAEQELSNVQAKEKAAMDRAEKNIAAYEQNRGEEVRVNIQRLESEYEQLVKERYDILALMNEEIEECKGKIEQGKSELASITAELNSAREEHEVLAEAIGKAAEYFKR